MNTVINALKEHTLQPLFNGHISCFAKAYCIETQATMYVLYGRHIESNLHCNHL